MLAFLLILFLLYCSSNQTSNFLNCTQDSSSKYPLYFLGFFPCLSNDHDEYCDRLTLTAVQLAIETINQDTNLLKCFNIELVPVHIRDPEQDPTEIIRILTNRYNRQQPIHGVIGPYHAETAKLFGNNFTIFQISYSVTDPALRDKHKYPYFHSTVPSDDFLNQIRVKLLEHFNWQRVGILCSDDTHHVQVAHNLVKVLRNNSKSNYQDIKFLGSFISSPNELLSLTKPQDLRIFIAIVQDTQVRVLLCQAYRTGLTSADHVWILPGIYDPQWWYLDEEPLNSTQYNCTNEQMMDAINTTLFVDSLQLNVKDKFDESATVFSKIFNKSTINSTSHILHSKVLNAYDATTALALTWNMTLVNLTTTTTGDHNDLNILLNQSWKITTDSKRKLVDSLQYHLENVISPYSGLAGNYLFNNSQDLYGAALITQFIGDRECVLGTYESISGGVISSLIPCDLEECCNASWKGNHQPADRHCSEMGQSCTCHIFSTKAKISLIFFSVLFSVGIVVSIALQSINFIWRNERYFKSSSPGLNAIVTFGTTLVYITGLLLLANYAIGLNGSHSFNLKYVCNSTVVMNWLSVSIINVTILIKNWRIFRIFHNPFEKEKKFLSDRIMYIGVIVLILPVIINMIVLISFFPLPVHHALFPSNECPLKSQYNTHYVLEEQCFEEFGLAADYFSMLYTVFGIVFILGLGCYNCRNIQSQYYKQEGGIAILVTSLYIFLTVIYLIMVTIQFNGWENFARIENLMPYLSSLFWIYPSFVLTVLYLPKMIGVVKDRRKLKTTRNHRKSTLRRKLHNLRSEALELKDTLQKMRNRNFTDSQDVINHS